MANCWPSWKSILPFFSRTERPTDMKLGKIIWLTCRSKIAKIFPIWNPKWPPCSHLENLFFASSLELKGQLIWNLVRSIRVTCRSKIPKIVWIGNPRWLPSWKSILNVSEQKSQLTWNLVGSNRETCRSKIGKIFLIRNYRWPPSWKSILCFFFWTKRPTYLKLDWKHWGEL